MRIFLLLIIMLAQPVIALAGPEQYAKLASYSNMKISPSGKYIAASSHQDDEASLVFFDRKTMQVMDVMKLRKPDYILDFFWATDERVVLGVGRKDRFADQLITYGELFAVDVGSNRGKFIFGYRAGKKSTKSIQETHIAAMHRNIGRAWARVIDVLPDDKSNILVSAVPWSFDQAGKSHVYKLNIYTSKITPITVAPTPYAHIFTDGKGSIIGARGINENSETEVFLYRAKDNDWQRAEALKAATDFKFVHYDTESNELLFTASMSRDTQALFKMDKDGKVTEVLGHPTLDITSVLKLGWQKPYAVRLDPNSPQYISLGNDNSYAHFFKALSTKLKGQTLWLTSSSQDNNHFIFAISNDKNPGAFYLRDVKNNKNRLLTYSYPEIDNKDLHPSRSFQIKAADGKSLTGYVTQADKVKQGAPSVLLMNSDFGYHRYYQNADAKTQMLANEGFKVIRLNYRGLPGFGNKFTQEGEKLWSEKTQQDLTLALSWLRQNKVINGNKLCIWAEDIDVYRALLQINSDTTNFSCLVAGDAIVDIDQYAYKSAFNYRTYGKTELAKRLGADEELWDKQSIINQLKGYQLPTLFVHPKKARLNYVSNIEKVINKMEQQGATTELITIELGRSLYAEQDGRELYYSKALEFIKQHNP